MPVCHHGLASVFPRPRGCQPATMAWPQCSPRLLSGMPALPPWLGLSSYQKPRWFHDPLCLTPSILLMPELWGQQCHLGLALAPLEYNQHSCCMLLFSRSRTSPRSTFLPNSKLSWVVSCPDGTHPIVPVQSVGLPKSVDISNNYSLFPHMPCCNIN